MWKHLICRLLGRHETVTLSIGPNYMVACLRCSTVLKVHEEDSA